MASPNITENEVTILFNVTAIPELIMIGVSKGNLKEDFYKQKDAFMLDNNGKVWNDGKYKNYLTDIS